MLPCGLLLDMLIQFSVLSGQVCWLIFCSVLSRTLVIFSVVCHQAHQLNSPTEFYSFLLHSPLGCSHLVKLHVLVKMQRIFLSNFRVYSHQTALPGFVKSQWIFASNSSSSCTSSSRTAVHVFIGFSVRVLKQLRTFFWTVVCLFSQTAVCILLCDFSLLNPWSNFCMSFAQTLERLVIGLSLKLLYVVSSNCSKSAITTWLEDRVHIWTSKNEYDIGVTTFTVESVGAFGKKSTF
jgi:hypothetical protein